MNLFRSKVLVQRWLGRPRTGDDDPGHDARRAGRGVVERSARPGLDAAQPRAEPGDPRRTGSDRGVLETALRLRSGVVRDEDLGAVGAVGVPSAVGISFDPEAVVDLGVVPLAEQRGVLQGGLAVVGVPFAGRDGRRTRGRGGAAGEMQVWSRSSTARAGAGGTAVAAAEVQDPPSGPMTIRVTVPSQASQRARAAEIAAPKPMVPAPGPVAGSTRSSRRMGPRHAA